MLRELGTCHPESARGASSKETSRDPSASLGMTNAVHEKAPAEAGAKSLQLSLSRDGRTILRLSLLFVALLALGLELRVLILVQDFLGLVHVLGLARFGATGFLMFGHRRIHLRLLLGSKAQAGKRNLTRHFFLIPGLLCAITV
jgi:hypothetical protein